MHAEEKEVSRTTARVRGNNGVFILTNRRILFQHSSGLLSTQTHTALEFPLVSVKEVKLERSLMKSKLVLFVQGEGYTGVPRVEVEIGDPEKWRSMISSQLSSRLAEIDEEKRRSRIQYVVDFSFLKAQMERGGISLQSIKCPSCGACVEMPAQGNTLKCTYCGSLVQSQDVYERMKGLLQSL